MPTKLTQKTVLVTGATKGIGLAISKHLTSQWKVIGIARQPLDNFPGKLFCTDLSDKKATEITLQEIQTQYSIDAVVNNVGMTMPVFRQVHEMNLEELLVLWNMNVRTTAQITQAFVESMKTQRWGRIINITSRAPLALKD